MGYEWCWYRLQWFVVHKTSQIIDQNITFHSPSIALNLTRRSQPARSKHHGSTMDYIWWYMFWHWLDNGYCTNDWRYFDIIEFTQSSAWAFRFVSGEEPSNLLLDTACSTFCKWLDSHPTAVARVSPPNNARRDAARSAAMASDQCHGRWTWKWIEDSRHIIMEWIRKPVGKATTEIL